MAVCLTACKRCSAKTAACWFFCALLFVWIGIGQWFSYIMGKCRSERQVRFAEVDFGTPFPSSNKSFSKKYTSKTHFRDHQNLIFFFVDSLPLHIMSKHVLPKVRANVGYDKKNVVVAAMDRDMSTEYSHVLIPILFSGSTLESPQSFLLNENRHRKVNFHMQSQDLYAKPLFGRSEFWNSNNVSVIQYKYVGEGSNRWIHEKMHSRIFNEAVDNAIASTKTSSKKSGKTEVIYDLRVDALGHMFKIPVDGYWDECDPVVAHEVKQITAAFEKLLRHTLENPENLLVVISDHGSQKFKGVRIHGFPTVVNSAFAVFASANDLRAGFKENIPMLNNEYSKKCCGGDKAWIKEAEDFSKNDDLDFVMRGVDLAATVGYLMRDGAMPADSLGIPFGGKANLEDSVVGAICLHFKRFENMFEGLECSEENLQRLSKKVEKVQKSCGSVPAGVYVTTAVFFAACLISACFYMIEIKGAGVMIRFICSFLCTAEPFLFLLNSNVDPGPLWRIGMCVMCCIYLLFFDRKRDEKTTDKGEGMLFSKALLFKLRREYLGVLILVLLTALFPISNTGVFNALMNHISPLIFNVLSILASLGYCVKFYGGNKLVVMAMVYISLVGTMAFYYSGENVARTFAEAAWTFICLTGIISMGAAMFTVGKTKFRLCLAPIASLVVVASPTFNHVIHAFLVYPLFLFVSFQCVKSSRFPSLIVLLCVILLPALKSVSYNLFLPMGFELQPWMSNIFKTQPPQIFYVGIMSFFTYQVLFFFLISFAENLIKRRKTIVKMFIFRLAASGIAILLDPRGTELHNLDMAVVLFRSDAVILLAALLMQSSGLLCFFNLRNYEKKDNTKSPQPILANI